MLCFHLGVLRLGTAVDKVSAVFDYINVFLNLHPKSQRTLYFRIEWYCSYLGVGIDGCTHNVYWCIVYGSISPPPPVGCGCEYRIPGTSYDIMYIYV